MSHFPKHRYEQSYQRLAAGSPIPEPSVSAGSLILPYGPDYTGTAGERHRFRLHPDFQWPAGAARTLQARIEVPSYPGASAHLFQYGSATSGIRWHVVLLPGGNIRFQQQGFSGPTEVVAAGAGAIPIDQEVILAITRDASNNWVIYVDGVSKSTASNVNAFSPVAGELNMGSDGLGGSLWLGSISEMALFHEVVSSAGVINPATAKFYWNAQAPA